MTSASATLYTTQVRFCRALAIVRSLPTESKGTFQPSVAERLDFYGLYKQALEGDCLLSKPSSRKIVEYAKWKSWDKLKGITPIDAQTMYIYALIDLLDQYLQKYPNSELSENLEQSLNYLQETEDNTNNTAAAASLEDERWDTTASIEQEEEREEYSYLGNIEQDQLLLSENLLHHYDYSDYNNSPATSAEELPLTPQLSPRQISRASYQNYKKNDYTVTSAFQQQQNEDRITSPTILNYETSVTPVTPAMSATPAVSSTPSSPPLQFSFQNQQYPAYHTFSSLGTHDDTNSNTKKSKRKSLIMSKRASSQIAIQTLQTEVAALCEEVDHLRESNSSCGNRRGGSDTHLIQYRQWLWLAKSVAKHTVFNSLVLMMLFLVLWKRKSPIAFVVIGYTGPRLRNLFKYLFTRVVFWKVTV